MAFSLACHWSTDPAIMRHTASMRPRVSPLLGFYFHHFNLMLQCFHKLSSDIYMHVKVQLYISKIVLTMSNCFEKCLTVLRNVDCFV